MKSGITTCAVCRGDITYKSINTVFWMGHTVDLCLSCFRLGSEDGISDGEITELLLARADPDAPKRGFTDSVTAWLQDHEK